MEEKGLRHIRARYAKKDVAFRQWTCGIEFYGNHDDGIIIVMGGGIHLLYASDSKERFDELHRALSGIGMAL